MGTFSGVEEVLLTERAEDPDKSLDFAGIVLREMNRFA